MILFFLTDVFTVYIKYIFTVRLWFKQKYLTIRLNGLHFYSSVSLSYFAPSSMEKSFVLELQPGWKLNSKLKFSTIHQNYQYPAIRSDIRKLVSAGYPKTGWRDQYLIPRPNSRSGTTLDIIVVYLYVCAMC